MLDGLGLRELRDGLGRLRELRDGLGLLRELRDGLGLLDDLGLGRARRAAVGAWWQLIL